MTKKKLIIGLLVGLLLVTSLFYVSNQKSTKKAGLKDVPKVGVLQYVSHPALDDIYQGFIDTLEKAGYIDGETIQIEFQNGQGDPTKLSTMGQHLLDQQPDVLMGLATPAAQVLANLTTEVPLVLGAVSDPLGAKLVTDMTNPGGNITGVSPQTPIKPQIELIQQVLPKAKVFGIVYSSAEDNSLFQVKKMTEEAEKVGLTVKKYPVNSTNDLPQIIQVMSEEVDFIYVPTANMIASAMDLVVDIATKNQVPIIPAVDTMISQGGIAGVGLNQYKIGVAVANMTIDILTGKSEPATTPIQVYQEGEIIVNPQQATRLGITLPAELVKEAIQVGE